MANSALHAIAINKLSYNHPDFYAEYWKLVGGISKLISNIANHYPKDLEFTSFTESYDRASNEPVLQVVIGLHRNEKHLQIHIHKDNHFVVGKVSSGKPAYMAAQALDAVEKALAIS